MVLADRLEAELETTAAALGGSAAGVFAVPMDISEPASVEFAVAAAGEFLGAVDGLANVAGIVRHADPLEVPRSDWEAVFAVNVFGAYDVSRRVAAMMVAGGVHGSIVQVASEAGKVGHRDSLAYSASKAALINITRMLSLSLAAHDINVNCVCPGGMPTAMLREVADAYSPLTGVGADELFDQMTSPQLGRHPQPREVARTISYLLSDDAFMIRGQAVNVDAGDTPY